MERCSQCCGVVFEVEREAWGREVTLTGEHNRTARQLLGWSQVALAIRAGVCINQLQNFENGMTAPRSATVTLRCSPETANATSS